MSLLIVLFVGWLVGVGASRTTFGGMTYAKDPMDRIYARPEGHTPLCEGGELDCTTNEKMGWSPLTREQFMSKVADEEVRRRSLDDQWRHEVLDVLGPYDRPPEVVFGDTIFALARDEKSFYARPKNTPPRIGCDSEAEWILYQSLTPREFMIAVKELVNQ